MEELWGRAKREGRYLKICAPMVRYSKLPFRILARLYGADLCFTPMIMSDSFSVSEKARNNEFTTREDDRPLVVQFAANNVEDFVASCQLVSGHVDGVDLNCGCPQRWALQEGIGACLIDRPEFVADLVRQTRNRCRGGLSISVKIRIHPDVADTVELCRRVEAAGVDFITVHGRRKDQRSDPVNYEAIRLVKQSVGVPVVANGDVTSLEAADNVVFATGADGVMAARGMLENPAMFAGAPVTPRECVDDWISTALRTGTPFSTFHHHLIYMCEKSMSRTERKYFNTLGSTASILDYFQSKYGIAGTTL